MTKIFVVTVFTKLAKENIFTLDLGEKRLCGWYNSAEQAFQALYYNHRDIYEGKYTYALMEAVHDGMLPVIKQTDRQLFSWNKDEHGYRERREPNWMANFVNVSGYFE